MEKCPWDCSPKSSLKFRGCVEVSRVTPSLDKLLLYCANSSSSDIFVHMILDWAVNRWFLGMKFLVHLSAMLILLPYASLWLHSQQSLQREQGAESIFSISFAYCKGWRSSESTSCWLQTPWTKAQKADFRLATLLVVDALLLFWAHGTEWIHWVTGL